MRLNSFAPDFSCYLPDGTVLGRKQFLDAVASEMSKAVPPIIISLNQVRLEIQGDSAATASKETTEYSASVLSNQLESEGCPTKVWIHWAG